MKQKVFEFIIMDFPVVILLLSYTLCAENTQLSQKYLQDTIKDLKLKTNSKQSGIGHSQPSLNTLSLRRVYTPPPEMASFAQSHDSLSAEVDKMLDNVASMVSAASDDNEETKPPPPQYSESHGYQEYHNSAQPPRSPTIQALQGAQGSQAAVPALHLTKSELASLYANAVHKGDTIKLDGGENHSGDPITAAVHEVDAGGHVTKPNLNAAKRPDNGYYYYYYPLKSFMDELASSPSVLSPSQNSSAASDQNNKSTRKNGQFQSSQSYKAPYYHPPSSYHPQPAYHHHHDPYYHPHTHHTHQHNVNINTPKPPTMMMDDKKKGLEPLFMAISGFIGMTVMFILSALVLPKFHKLKPKGWRREGLQEEEEELYGIGRVALEAIDGYDCMERFACEAGKTANALGLYHNRFVKLLRRIGPVSLVRQINRLGKYTNKKYRCAAIRCKQRGVAPKPPIKLT
ncbi:uncharacterized protein [Atheta coriaria]|uniref:uncharacterized protein isoform X2 n=1 Tax=Dalotia coriaria TaxID=877792 RepID=UPI0031F3B673